MQGPLANLVLKDAAKDNCVDPERNRSPKRHKFTGSTFIRDYTRLAMMRLTNDLLVIHLLQQTYNSYLENHRIAFKMNLS